MSACVVAGYQPAYTFVFFVANRRIQVAFRAYRRRMFYYAAIQAKYRVKKMEWHEKQVEVSFQPPGLSTNNEFA